MTYSGQDTDRTPITRRGALTTVGGLITGAFGIGTPVSAQSGTLEGTNDQVEIQLDNLRSKSYISSFQSDGTTLFERHKPINPLYDLQHTETVNAAAVTAEGWQGYTTERRYEYGATDLETSGGQLRFSQTSLLPDDDPLVITEFEITNEASNPITVRRPDTHIHDGWIVSRLPPLNNPTGSYRYYIQGDQTRRFADGDLWHARDLSLESPFITYFDDERGMTTKYLGGETQPNMTVTYAEGDITEQTTADVETASDLPHSEDNPPARQTPGFSINNLHLCVNGFTIDPSATVTFATALFTHAGGTEAITRAEDLSQTAESHYSEMPSGDTLEEPSASSGLVTRFQQFSGGGSLLPGLVGLAGVGALGVGLYRRFTGSETEAAASESPAEDTATVPAESPSEPSAPSLQTTTYGEYEQLAQLRASRYVVVTEAIAPESQVAVALYGARTDNGNTVEASVFDKVAEGFDAWSTIDDHENMLTVYTHGETPTPWAAVELADEQFSPVAYANKSLETKRNLVIDLCNAVHEGHRYGLSHGNIPSSTFISQDGKTPILKLGNWGLTKEALDDTATQESDIKQVTELAAALFTGNSLADIEFNSISYPDGLISVFKPVMADGEGYETIVHFRDAISEAI